MEEKNLLETYFKEESPKMKNKPKLRQIVLSETEPELLNVDKFPVQSFADFPEAFNTSIDTVDVQVINTNNEELNKTTESLLEEIGDTWNCRVCGQTNVKNQTLQRHIKSKHTTGTYHPCKVCGKIFRSSNSINTHMSKLHPK